MIRRPARRKGIPQGQVSRPTSRVAPVRGWNTRDPVSSMRPEYARVLDNFFPTASGVSLRKGAVDHVVGLPNAVKRLMPYQGRANSKLFASTDLKIFDATGSASNPPALLARTRGEHIHTNFATTGDTFLLAANGVDDLARYTGSTNTWTTVPTFTIAAGSGGGTLNTNTIAAVGAFRRRLFFVTNAAVGFYYLPIDSISGELSFFPLGGLMSRGGYIMAMGSWSVDADGQDDYVMFLTSRGQAIVYKGDDPSNAASWALRGVFQIGPPLGRGCITKVKGDLLVLTEGGLFSMNTAIGSVEPSLEPGFTDTISPTFREFAALTGQTYGWHVEVLERDSLLIVNVPQQALGSFNQFVMNLDTKAWCRFVGWEAYNFATLDNTLYYAAQGKVVKAWQPGGDFGTAITAVGIQAYDMLGTPTNKKFHLFRPVYTLSGIGQVAFGTDVDFQSSSLYENTAGTAQGTSRWDSAQWDQSLFAALPSAQLSWQTLSASEGYRVSVRLRFIGQDAIFEWNTTDYLFETGSPV